MQFLLSKYQLSPRTIIRTFLLVFFALFFLLPQGYAEESTEVPTIGLSQDKSITTKIGKIRLQIEAGTLQDALDGLNEILRYHPSIVEVHYIKAQVFFLQGEKQQALDYLTAQIQLHPENLEFLIARGKYLREKHYHQSAWEDLLTAYKQGGKSIDLFQNLFFLSKERKNLEEQNLFIKKAVQFSPESGDLWYEKGILEWQFKKTQEAQISIAQALKLDPESAQYTKLYIELLQRTNQKEKAKELLEKAIKKFSSDSWFALKLSSHFVENQDLDAALAVLEKAFLVLPEEADLYFQFAIIYSGKNDPKTTIEMFEEGLRYKPDSVWANVQLGKLYVTEQKYNRAIEYLLNAKGLGAKDISVYDILAQIYNQQENYYNAEQIVLEGLSLDPQSQSLLLLYGNLLQRRGQYQSAIRAYQEVLQKNPDHYALHGRVGNLYRILGKFREAKQYFKKALSLKADAHLVRSFYIETLFDEKNWSATLEQLEILIKSVPNEYWAYSRKALVEYRLGNPEQALSDINKAIILNPDQINLKETEGIILLSLGKSDLAVTSFQEALRKNPQDTRILTNLAYAQRLDYPEEALKNLNLVMQELEPNLKKLELYLHLTGKNQQLWKFTEAEAQIYQDILQLNFQQARKQIEEQQESTLNLKLLRYFSDSLETDRVLHLPKAEILSAKEPQAWHYYYLAYHLTLQSQDKEAVTFLEKALSLDPGNIWVKAKLGTLYDKVNQPLKGIQYLQEFLEQYPQSYWANMRLALNYDLAKLPAESEFTYLKILEKKPNNSLALNNLAWMYLTTPNQEYRKVDQALELSLQAVDLDSSAANLDTLAEAYYQKKEYQKAINAIERALFQDTNNTDYFKRQKIKILKAQEEQKAIRSESF